MSYWMNTEYSMRSIKKKTFIPKTIEIRFVVTPTIAHSRIYKYAYRKYVECIHLSGICDRVRKRWKKVWRICCNLTKWVVCINYTYLFVCVLRVFIILFFCSFCCCCCCCHLDIPLHDREKSLCLYFKLVVGRARIELIQSRQIE